MSSHDDMYPDIALRVGGELVPAHELTWVKRAPCGCESGWHLVIDDMITEEKAWTGFYPAAPMRKRAQDQGFTISLAKRASMTMTDCNHDPKWGVTPRPELPGHTWVGSRSARALHLVPIVVVKDTVSAFVPEGTSSLCGRVQPCWSRKWYDVEDRIECKGCLKAAGSAVAA